jgi:hypothetical protein
MRKAKKTAGRKDPPQGDAQGAPIDCCQARIKRSYNSQPDTKAGLKKPDLTLR